MTFSPIRKANVVFDALEAQGLHFPNVPVRVEENPNGTVRIDINMEGLNQEAADQLIAIIPADFAYEERAYAYRATTSLLGIIVVFRFFIDTQAHEEAR